MRERTRSIADLVDGLQQNATRDVDVTAHLRFRARQRPRVYDVTDHALLRYQTA